MNLQVISTPEGDVLRVSRPLPGSVYDLTAARIRGIIRQLAAAGLITLADKGYIGAGQHVLTPYRAGANRPRRKQPAPPAPGCALPASARTPSSRPGTSCPSFATGARVRILQWQQSRRQTGSSWPSRSGCGAALR